MSGVSLYQSGVSQLCTMTVPSIIRSGLHKPLTGAGRTVCHVPPEATAALGRNRFAVGSSVVGRCGRLARYCCHAAGCDWKYLILGAASGGATRVARLGIFGACAPASPRPNAAVDAMASPSIDRIIHEFVIGFPLG